MAKKKLKRNITGLRNQSKTAGSHVEEVPDDSTEAKETPETQLKDADMGQQLNDNEGVLAIEVGDDPRDEDWIPDSLQRERNARISRARPRPKFYQKGPDVGSKSERTRSRYKDVLKGQQTLENLGFVPQAEPHMLTENTSKSSPYPSSSTTTCSVLEYEPTEAEGKMR